MCHQSIGLIARHLESTGIATVTLSSARSITESVRPPRSVFVDYPLGHTAGKPHDPNDQDRILSAAFELLESSTEPGEIRDLASSWDEQGDRWKEPLLDPEAPDERTERRAEPQYERATDADLVRDGIGCDGCIWLQAPNDAAEGASAGASRSS